MSRPRALVLRALGLGDFLTSVPAHRALRRALPGHEITLAASGVLRPLVQLCAAVDRLLPTGELEPVPWTGRPPELAIGLHGRGPQSLRLLAALQPARLVGFDCPEAGVTGPSWEEDEHEVRRWTRLVHEEFGGSGGAGPVTSEELRIDVPAVAPAVRDAFVVHPGAEAGARRWPADRFAAVARWASGRGWPVVVTGGPREVALARRVQEEAGLPEDAVLAGRTDLRQLAALVAAARTVVCGDTGVAHLASAFATPSVVLFGPLPPRWWGPPADGPHVALWKGTGVADSHADEPDPALLEITVEEVLEALAVTDGYAGQAGRLSQPR